MNTESKSLDIFRFERKYLVSYLDKNQIETLIKIHPAMFSEIHHERFINNIYFDYLAMNNYFANIDGLQHRTKSRIRWYGDLFRYIDDSVLELKIKDGLVGRKKSYPLQPFTLDHHFQIAIIQEVFRNSDLPSMLKEDMITQQPTLLNRYLRKYYESADRNYRITIDTQMEFYRIDLYNNTFLNKTIDNTNVVVELKYKRELDEKAAAISGFFPFRISRNSKYINGIQNFYLQ